MSIRREIDERLYEAVKSCLVRKFGQETGLFFHRWLVSYRSDASFLYKVYDLVKSKRPEAVIDEDRGLTYHVIKDELYISRKDGHEACPLALAAMALQVMLDMSDDYLPLGSVVSLDKEQLGQTMDLDSVDEFRVVITQRMAALSDIPVYFNYGGLIYPFGSFEGAESIYFAKDLVKEVIHEGFSDETDLAYIAAMKAEYIVNRSYTSFLLASQEIQQQAREELRSKGE